MNKTTLLILSLFLVGGVGAYLALSDRPALDLPIVEDEVPRFDELESPAEGQEVQGPRVPDEEEKEAALPEGLAELMREEVGGDAGPAKVLTVQVWDRKRGVPAMDTDVFFVDGFDGPELKDPFAQHWSDLAERKGEKYKTDAHGRVELPAVEKWAIVTAQRSGAFGFTKIGRRHRRVEVITLQNDETVTVRVLDGEDRPVADAPVGIVQSLPVRENVQQMQQLMAQMDQLQQAMANVETFIRQNPGMKERAAERVQHIRARQGEIKRQMAAAKRGGKGGKGGKGRGKRGEGRRTGPQPSKKNPQFKISTRKELRARRRTDENGVAVIRHFQVYRAKPAKWWPAQHSDRFEAVLLAPLAKPEGTKFSGRPVPKDPIELRIPDTGSIALRTVDLDGRPYTHPVHAELRVRGGPASPWMRVRVRKDQNGTEIEFPFVGLGLEFTANCRLDDDDFRWTVASIVGPQKPGERVTVDVVVAPNEGMLFGRLVSDAGKPLAGLRPSFLINTSAGRLEGEDVTTDVDGRFHLPYQVRKQHRPPFRLEVRRNEVRPVAGVAMPLQGLPAGRITDLGDLALGAFDAVARGVVTDDRGQPIPGAIVQLQRQRDVGKNQQTRAFVDEAFVVAKADGEGRYELFGKLESARYRLRVQAHRHFPHESLDVRPGGRMDIELTRLAKVVGTVLAPKWMPSRDLRVVLESAVDAKQRREDRVHDYKGQKFVYFDWVRPGIYNVMVRLTGFPDPILRIDGFQIEPGQIGVHPRLKDLDITSLLHRFEIEAVDGNGQGVRPDWPLVAAITRPDGRVSHVGFPWQGRTVRIVSASPQLEVWPRASGYRAARTVLGPGPSQLRFEKVSPVEVQLRGFRNVAKDALVWVKLQATGPVAGPLKLETWDGPSHRVGRKFIGMKRREGGALLGADDVARMPLLADGRFRVTAFLLGTTKGRKSRPESLAFGEVDVRVVPGADPVRLSLTVDVAKLQQALARLAQREAAGKR